MWQCASGCGHGLSVISHDVTGRSMCLRCGCLKDPVCEAHACLAYVEPSWVKVCSAFLLP
jgi:hypothetical protein